ncbi:MAG: hypothetical protein HDS75_02315 [Bacteroidales bacterium]|nr:hypothetical protein [Bacteroidales bacterium]
MASILLWIGIAVTVIGWLALFWQASKRLAVNDELDKLPRKKAALQLRRNYCLMTILAGMVIIMIALII